MDQDHILLVLQEQVEQVLLVVYLVLQQHIQEEEVGDLFIQELAEQVEQVEVDEEQDQPLQHQEQLEHLQELQIQVEEAEVELEVGLAQLEQAVQESLS